MSRPARHLLLGTMLIVAAVLGLGATQALAAPVNDDWANATTLTGASATAPVSFVGSTLEPGESQPVDTSTSSVWFKWTAPVSGPVLAWGCPPSGSEPYVTAYTGATLATATRLSRARAPICVTGASLHAVAGTTYHFQLFTTAPQEWPSTTVRLVQRSSGGLSWTPPAAGQVTGPTGGLFVKSLFFEGHEWFSFKADAAECLVDGAKTHLTSCSGSGGMWSGLAAGSHTFSHRATDPWGFWSTWSTTPFTVETTPPVIAIQSTLDVSTGSPTLTYTSDTPGTTFECDFQTGTWKACAGPTPWPYVGSQKGYSPSGDYGFLPAPGTVKVRGTDTHSNVSPVQTFTWAGPPPPAPDPVKPVAPAPIPVTPGIPVAVTPAPVPTPTTPTVPIRPTTPPRYPAGCSIRLIEVARSGRVTIKVVTPTGPATARLAIRLTRTDGRLVKALVRRVALKRKGSASAGTLTFTAPRSARRAVVVATAPQSERYLAARGRRVLTLKRR